jgi:hypothetical protein
MLLLVTEPYYSLSEGQLPWVPLLRAWSEMHAIRCAGQGGEGERGKALCNNLGDTRVSGCGKVCICRYQARHATGANKEGGLN